VLPTRVVDWAVRKIAFLTDKGLGLGGAPHGKPADMPLPVAKPAVDTRATAPN
jgi:hypothetical protein